MSDTGVQGKENLVSIADSDGTTMLEVEQQGDASYDNGKTTERVVNKNGQMVYIAEAGATITFSMSKSRPLLPGQARIFAVADTGQSVKVVYEDAKAGGHKREGEFAVSIGEEAANTEGMVEVPVTLLATTPVAETVNS